MLSEALHFKGNSTSTIKTGRAKTGFASPLLIEQVLFWINMTSSYLTGFEHSCSLLQAEAEVKTILQATILIILFNCTSHVYWIIHYYFKHRNRQTPHLIAA